MTTTPPPPLTENDLFQLLERANFAGLTLNHLRILLLVSLSTPENPSNSCTTIASRMMLSPTAITDNGKILDKRGFITRKRLKADDRKVIYKLTKKCKDYLLTIRTGEKMDNLA